MRSEERTEKKNKSRTRNMPVEEGNQMTDEELTGYSYR